MSRPGGRRRPLWLLCATSAEARATRQGLARAAGGDHGCEVLQLGMGAERAGPALAARLTRLQTHGVALPQAVISFGLAASTADRLGRGRWATCTLLRAAGRPTLHPTMPLATWVGAELASRCAPCPWRQVALPTCVRGADEVGCLDMESHAWATVAREQGVEWGVMRLVSDAPATPLPAAILSWADGARARGVAAGLGAPRALWSFCRAMWQLGRQLAATSQAIATARSGQADGAVPLR